MARSHAVEGGRLLIADGSEDSSAHGSENSSAVGAGSAGELRGQRWVVVAEEEILPATTGCRVDHLGFLEAAAAAGVRLLLVVPARARLDPAAYAAALPGVEVLTIPRDERAVRHLSRLPYVVASRPAPTDLTSRVEALLPDPTAVVSYSVRVAHLGLRLAADLRLPHLVRCQNLDSAYFRDIAAKAAPVRRVGYLVEARKLAWFERGLNASAFVTAFADVSAGEAQEHRLHTAHPVLHVPSFALSSVAAAAEAAATVPARAGVVFVGSLDVETNQLAVAWLLDEVWPAVRAEHAAVTLAVVGRAPSAELRARVLAAEGQGVRLHADVPTVTPFLQAAAVCVNPVRTGAGINVKLLQGMAAGCAGVSTTVGAVGLDWVAGRDLEVADSPAAFSAAVLGLLADPGRCAALAERGRDLVRERLDPARGVRAFAEVLRAATRPAAARLS